jgi:hypothetical protein
MYAQLAPIARVIGVVLPEDLCDSPTNAAAMHALLEVELLTCDKLLVGPTHKHLKSVRCETHSSTLVLRYVILCAGCSYTVRARNCT